MNEELRNSIIVIVVLAILVGLAWYFGNKKEEITGSTETPSQETTGTENQEETTGIENPSTQTGGSTGTTTASTTEKFNTLMASAQKAFINKNYGEALTYYEAALAIQKVDTVYSGMYTVYTAEADWTNAILMLDKAIALNPLPSDYWNWKINLLNAHTATAYADLKKIYEVALTKVLPVLKINLVTNFADIAERKGEISEAISLWKFAQELNPENTLVYQAEIDRLENN